jgi:Uma2 family endonuclease
MKQLTLKRFQTFSRVNQTKEMLMMTHSKFPPIRSLPTDREVEYPDSDGKPMAETDFHYDVMDHFRKMLKGHFHHQSDVYISGNLLMYYEKGNPKKSIAPDVFVVFGVENRKRETYMLWEEGKGPDFVLEVSSKNTYRTDLRKKKRLYAQVLRVEDYFLYDPNHLYLNPPLQGYRLLGGRYVKIIPVAGRLPSRVLGLEVGYKPDGQVGLYNPQTQAWLLIPEERAEQAEARAQHAEARAEQALAIAEQALARAQHAEAELTRLRALLEQLSTQQPHDH